MMNHWLFRCKDITELISQSMDEKLPLRIRLGIKFHLMMCDLCSRYKKQLELIRNAILKINEDIAAMPAPRLPDEFKEKLKKMFK
jgi:hypothetical protein